MLPVLFLRYNLSLSDCKVRKFEFAFVGTQLLVGVGSFLVLGLSGPWVRDSGSDDGIAWRWRGVRV